MNKSIERHIGRVHQQEPLNINIKRNTKRRFKQNTQRTMWVIEMHIKMDIERNTKTEHYKEH